MKAIAAIFTGLWSILQGLAVTITNALRRPRITLMYPRQREAALSPRTRGLLVLRRDPETGKLRCTACGLCEKACPSRVITIEPEGEGKERHPKRYTMDLGHCLFCHLCVEACPFEAIAMNDQYERAGYDRSIATLGFEELTDGKRPAGYTQKELAALPTEEAGRKPAEEAPHD
jgi:NADH-quinone oxidoreductase chain I